MKNNLEVSNNLINLARESPPEIPDEILEKILNLGLIMRDFGSRTPVKGGNRCNSTLLKILQKGVK